MPLYLCKDERVLKNWTFASDETSAGQKDYNLIVTNKRLVSTSVSPSSITRTELPLSSIKSITGSYSTGKQEQANPKTGLIVLGILLLIAGVILLALLHSQAVGIIFGIGLAVTGFIIIIYGGAHSATITTYAGFTLKIVTYGQETSSLAIGKQFSSDNNTQTISVTHVTINELVVNEIIDALGALIIGREELEPATTPSQPKKKKPNKVDADGFSEVAVADETVLSKEN